MVNEPKKSYTPMRVIQVGSLADLTQATMRGTFFDCGNRVGVMMRMGMNARMYPGCAQPNRVGNGDDGDDE